MKKKLQIWVRDRDTEDQIVIEAGTFDSVSSHWQINGEKEMQATLMAYHGLDAREQLLKVLLETVQRDNPRCYIEIVSKH